MNYFLVKTDLYAYSIEDLKKDNITVWDGVKNAQAVSYLKTKQKGDIVLIYHSQGASAIRGAATVAANLGPDPKDIKSWLVRLKFLKVFDVPHITLKDIKTSGLFQELPLIGQSRLSVMPIPNEFIFWLRLQGLDI